jgi:predicted ester cyclase
MNSLDLVQGFYEEIWNRGDKAKIPEILHESFTFRGSIGQTKSGHLGFAEYVDLVRDALEDYRCEILEIVCDGHKAFAKVLFSGVHRKSFLGYYPTHKRVQWLGAALFTIHADKITDLWVLGDLDSLREQLSAAKE